MVQGLVEGFRYLRRQRVIAGVIGLGMTVSLFGAAFITLLPELADKVISGGIGTYSRLLLAAGAGGLGATAVIIMLGVRVNPARYLGLAGVGYGAGLLVLSQADGFLGAALIIGAIGSFHVVFTTMSTTLIQGMAADQYRGRVMSIQQFTWGATALGGLMAGALGQKVGVSFALALSGIIIAAATGMVILVSLRRAAPQGARPDAAPVASQYQR